MGQKIRLKTFLRTHLEITVSWVVTIYNKTRRKNLTCEDTSRRNNYEE